MPDSAYKLSITISADTEQAKTNIDRLNEEFGRLLQSLGKTPEDIRAFSNLAQDFVLTGKAADDLDRETRELLTSYRTLVDVAKSRDILGLVPHDQIAAQIRQVEAAYQTLKKSGVLSQQEIAQAALVTERRIAELRAQTNNLAGALQTAKAEFAALAAAGGGLTLAVKQAMDFESAMADVAKVTGASGERLKSLGDEIKSLTADLPLSADALARIAAAGGQLGVPIEHLRTFTELAAKMATAFNMTADEAGSAIARLSNVFGGTLADIERIGDAVNTLGNNMAATERDILEVMNRIGGASKQFGLAADQAAALGAAMLSLGRTPEVAATGINTLLTKLQTAQVAGRDFQEALQRIGLDAGALAEQIRSQPQEALTTFLDTLRRLEPMARAEVITKLFGLEYQDDISALIGSIEQYERALGLVSDRQKTAGAMQDEFRARMQTTETQLRLLQNAVEAVAINLGTTFLPAVRRIAEGLADGTRAVADFVQQFPLISSLATTIATVAASVGALRTAFLAARLAGITLGTDVATALRAMSLPITEAVTALGRLQAAFSVFGSFLIGWDIGAWLTEKFEWARTAGVFMAESIVKALEYIRFGWESLKAVFTDDTVDAAVMRHQERLAQMESIFAGMYEQVKAGAWEAQQQAAAAAKAAADSSQASVEAARAATAQAATDALAAMGGVRDGAVQAATELQKLFASVAGGNVSTATLDAITAAVNQVAQSSQMAGDTIRQSLIDSITRLSTDTLAQFVTQAQMAWARTIEGADAAREVLDTGLAAALQRLGVDVSTLRTGISASMSELINLFDAVAQSGRVSAAEIMAALEGVAAKADSVRAVDSLRASVEELGRAGVLSAEQVAQAFGLLDRKAYEIQASLDPVAQAFRTLGIESAESLARMAAEARAAFERIRDSGTATAGDICRAWEAYAAAAMRAANAAGTAQAEATARTLDAERAALGLTEALEQAGSAGAEAGNKIAEGMGQARESIEGAAEAAEGTEGQQADVTSVTKEKKQPKAVTKIEGWELMSETTQREIQETLKNWYTQAGFNPIAKQQFISIVDETRRAVQDMDKLWKQIQTQGMSEQLAQQIEAWRRSYGALIDPSKYDSLVRALEDFRKGTQEAASVVSAASKAYREPTVQPQIRSDTKVEQLLAEIARSVESIARRVASASISPEQVASAVLHSLSAASTVS